MYNWLIEFINEPRNGSSHYNQSSNSRFEKKIDGTSSQIGMFTQYISMGEAAKCDFNRINSADTITNRINFGDRNERGFLHATTVLD